jgi:hypothetical protein
MQDEVNQGVSKTAVWIYECPCCYSEYEPEQRPDDGRCGHCEDRPNLREKQSQFGAGVVVCLAKFSEHLWTEAERRATELVLLLDGKITRDRLSTQAAADLSRAEGGYPFCQPGQDPLTAAAEDAVHMWASGAGDHFFDLDEDRAPQPLKDLADLVIRMRNTHLDSGWTLADGGFERVRELWQESCMALDRMLGTTPNWGDF